MSTLAEFASTREASRPRIAALTRGVPARVCRAVSPLVSFVTSITFGTCDDDSRDNRTCCPASPRTDTNPGGTHRPPLTLAVPATRSRFAAS